MSTEQTSLAADRWEQARQATPNEDAFLRPRWRPQGKQECQGCGGHVTPQFRKSLGDENDVAHACRECVTGNDLLDGAAGDPEWERRVEYDEGVHPIGGGER